MKRLLIAVAFVAAVAATAPAEGFQTHQDERVIQTVNVQAIKHRIRDRIHQRMGRWLDGKLEALTAPVPVTTEPTSTSTGTSSPTYSTSSSGWTLSQAEAASYARQAGFPESAISTLIPILERESNLCPTAVYGYGCAGEGHAYNGGPACGLAQLFPCPGAEYLDPLTNLRGAFAKYQASGWAPWGG